MDTEDTKIEILKAEIKELERRDGKAQRNGQTLSVDVNWELIDQIAQKKALLRELEGDKK